MRKRKIKEEVTPICEMDAHIREEIYARLTGKKYWLYDLLIVKVETGTEYFEKKDEAIIEERRVVYLHCEQICRAPRRQPNIWIATLTIKSHPKSLFALAAKFLLGASVGGMSHRELKKLAPSFIGKKCFGIVIAEKIFRPSHVYRIFPFIPYGEQDTLFMNMEEEIKTQERLFTETLKIYREHPGDNLIGGI